MAVLITGVSRGIGKEIVDQYRDAGESVIAIGRGEGVSVERDGDHIYIGFDWSQFDLLGQRLKEEGISVDRVINNAGLLIKDEIGDVDYNDFAEQMRVNVWNVMSLFRSLYRNGILASGSHIVSIGSMGGVQGALKFPGLFAYSASKAALVALTESLDAEYGAEGLSFNCLALGAVNTEMLKEAFPGYISEVDPEKMAEYIRSFVDGSGKMMSGKVIQVSKSNPEA